MQKSNIKKRRAKVIEENKIKAKQQMKERKGDDKHG